MVSRAMNIGQFAVLFIQTEPEKSIEITEHWLKTGEDV